MDLVVFQKLFSEHKEFIVVFIKRRHRNAKKKIQDLAEITKSLAPEDLEEIRIEVKAYWLEISNSDLNVNSMGKMLH